MQTLEQKIRFKNGLKDLIPNLTINDSVNEKINLINLVKQETEDFQEYDQVVGLYTDLLNKNNSIIDKIKGIITRVDEEILDLVAVRNKDIDSAKDIPPSACLSISSETESQIVTKIGSYSQLKYPGLQINCHYPYRSSAQDILPQNSLNALNWFNAMVSSDPLYLAGPIDEFGGIRYLEDMISPYPEIYQRRLRLYGLANRNLDILPQAQFGIIVCWGFFNYQTLETIEIYLNKLIRLLRPGGVLFFSYNNCDYIESARLFDNQQGNFCTEEIIKRICLSIGYEIIESNNLRTDIISYCSWIEIKRPGSLTTVKLSQAQGLVGRK